MRAEAVPRRPPSTQDFPSFSEGLSLRDLGEVDVNSGVVFPFLFGGTFIEGQGQPRGHRRRPPFPFLFGGTFIEGANKLEAAHISNVFPFLFGGTFIEGNLSRKGRALKFAFPFLFGGTFIEGFQELQVQCFPYRYCPPFSVGLSLRGVLQIRGVVVLWEISLPFRRDFH